MYFLFSGNSANEIIRFLHDDNNFYTVYEKTRYDRMVFKTIKEAHQHLIQNCHSSGHYATIDYKIDTVERFFHLNMDSIINNLKQI